MPGEPRTEPLTAEQIEHWRRRVGDPPLETLWPDAEVLRLAALFLATLDAARAERDQARTDRHGLSVLLDYGPRHTADCETCARPQTAYGRRLLAQLHGWPDRKEYPWNLLDAEDILAIEAEVALPRERAETGLDVKRLGRALVASGVAAHRDGTEWGPGVVRIASDAIAREYAALAALAADRQEDAT